MRRIGRFVVLVSRDGTRHALSVTAVAALCEGDDGTTTILLSGGRHVTTDVGLDELAKALSLPAQLPS